MNILSNLVKKNLVLNKRRTIVTIISIILSCALICGVATLFASFQKFMQDIVIEEVGNYHAVFNDVSTDDSKYVENNSSIKSSAISTNLGYSYFAGSTEETAQYIYTAAFSKEQFEVSNNIELESGRLPKTSEEIVLNESFNQETKLDYKIGDVITLNTGIRYLNGVKLSDNEGYYDYTDEESGIVYKEELQNITSKEYTIVGFISGNNLSSTGYTAITYLDNSLLSTVTTLNISVLTKDINNIYEDMENIADEINLPKVDGQYNIEYNNDLLRWYGVTDNDNANDMLYGFALILIAVIMVASIIVIYNSFNISITERKKQFGMLSSIGTTSKQIRNMVLKEGLLLSLIGIPLGILFGIIGIGITLAVVNSLGIFAGFYDTELTLTVIPLSIYVTIFFGGLTIFLSSLIPAIKASKTSPIDAIRNAGDIKVKGKKVRTPKFIRKLFGMEGDLALKNMKRNRKKYRSTVISLFVSIVLFMTINAFAEYALRSTIKVYNSYNFNVGVTDIDTATAKKLAKLNYIDEYTINRNAEYILTVPKKDLNSKAINDSDCNNETDTCNVNVRLAALGTEEFKRFINENDLKLSDYEDTSNIKIIMTAKSNFYNFDEGRYYQLTLTDYKQNDVLKLTSNMSPDVLNVVSIGKVTNKEPLGFNNADGFNLTIQGFVSDEVYDSLDDSVKEENAYLMIESSNPKKLMTEITKYAEDNNITINAINIEETVKILNNVVLAVSIFLYGFIAIVSLITITNIINTITTSIYLRRREFATLKAIGMTNKDFNRMIRFESLLYGIKALLYGLPVGIALDYLLFKNVSTFFVYDYAIPFKPIIISVLFVFIIIAITMSYSVRRIKNDNIIDVIKQENQ